MGDIILLAETEEEANILMRKVESACIKYNLRINVGKTKLMHIGRERRNINLRIEEGNIEQVREYKYLGFVITEDNLGSKNIRERIKMGCINLNKMNKIWKSRNISIKLKINLYDAIVLPTVLYGAEVWVLKEYENKKLLAFETTCLRRIMGIRKTERITNMQIRGWTNKTTTIIEKIRDIQRRWLGHVERMTNERLPKKALYHREDGTRPRGRPRKTWAKLFKENNTENSWQEITTLSRDRTRWRSYRRHHMRTQPS